MPDTIYVNGIDLGTYLTPISLLKGFIAPPPGVGADYQIPGYIGAIPATLGRGPRSVVVGGLILGWDITASPLPQVPVEDARAAYITKLENFSTAVFNGGAPFTFTWVHESSELPVTRTTTARYLGGVDDIETLTPWAGRVAVDIFLLDPLWH